MTFEFDSYWSCDLVMLGQIFANSVPKIAQDLKKKVMKVKLYVCRGSGEVAYLLQGAGSN